LRTTELHCDVFYCLHTASVLQVGAPALTWIKPRGDLHRLADAV
jgi:hypothetical protein